VNLGDSSPDTGLYIHLPFCLSRCGYCDFSVVTNRDDSQDQYLQCLQNEITFWSKRIGRPLVSLYFGGGTPSRFRPDLWSQLMSVISRSLVVEPGAEISTEANPESLNNSLLTHWLSLGVNRVSIGVQTFKDSLLSLIERRHTSEVARRVIDSLKASGIPGWSLDLIYGLPEQSLSDWEKDLDMVMEIEPPHISFYNLILHPGLPVTKKAIELLPADHEDLQAEMFLRAVERFKESGYEVYELSNAARPSHACRHNLLYWRGGEWIGMGLSASSYFNGQYFSNPATWETYIAMWNQVPDSLPLPIKTPSHEARLMDLVMLRLRTAEGLDLWEVESLLGRGVPDSLEGLIGDMQAHGYLREPGGALCLSPKGWLLHSEITTRIMNCLLGNPG